MRFHALTVADIRRETPNAVSLGFAVPEALRETFRYRPGQYLTLRAMIDGGEVRRSYSICSGLDEPGLRVGIKRLADGVFSTWASEVLRPGDRLDVMPPEGRFGLLPEAGRRRSALGLACGSGITPVLSVLRSILAVERESHAVLLYGNRTSTDIMFREALEELKDRYLDRFSLVHVLSREGQELSALHGRLDAARIGLLLPGLLRADEIDEALLCGPEGFAEEATRALLAYGVPAERVQAERFIPTGQPSHRPAPPVVAADAPPAALLRVTVDGLTRRIPVAEGETLLEAGLRAGLDLPWSCRGGMCCTCRARLTEGEAVMDQNWSLTAVEQAKGFVLTCQSRPKTRELALDYDAA